MVEHMRRKFHMIVRELNYRRQQLSHHSVIEAVVQGQTLEEAKKQAAAANARLSEADARQFVEMPEWESRLDVLNRMLQSCWDATDSLEKREQEALTIWTEDLIAKTEDEAVEAARTNQKLSDEEIQQRVTFVSENKQRLLSALDSEFQRSGMTPDQSKAAALEEYRHRRRVQFYLNDRNQRLLSAGADPRKDYALFNPDATPDVIEIVTRPEGDTK